jgi:hypothetical protein
MREAFVLGAMLPSMVGRCGRGAAVVIYNLGQIAHVDHVATDRALNEIFPRAVVDLPADNFTHDARSQDPALHHQRATKPISCMFQIALFGASSAAFDGSGDGLMAPDSTDWDFAGEFTLECWFRIPSPLGGNATRSLLSKYASSSAMGWDLNWFDSASSGFLAFNLSTNGTAVAHAVSSTTQLTGNTWHHCAVDRDSSNKIRLYLNGTMIGSKAAASGTPFNNTNPLNIGKRGSVDAPHRGWIDEVRITTGVARYASDSGFTVPTAAFPRS